MPALGHKMGAADYSEMSVPIYHTKQQTEILSLTALKSPNPNAILD
jgi:hypothetical protein